MKFKIALYALGFKSYSDYLESPHWKSFRASYRAYGRPLFCAVCSGRPICLHHCTYVRLGCEILDDVRPLCRNCHTALHDLLKSSGKIFVEFTDWAIAELRGEPRPATPASTRRKKKKKAKGRNLSRKCSGCNNTAKVGRTHCGPCMKRIGTYVPRSQPKPKEEALPKLVKKHKEYLKTEKRKRKKG